VEGELEEREEDGKELAGPMSVKLLPTRPVSRPRSSLQELSFVHFTCCEGQPASERFCRAVSCQYELIYTVFGRAGFERTTANLDLLLGRFNSVQYWVVTEMCLAQSISKRVQLLRKFIKIAA